MREGGRGEGRLGKKEERKERQEGKGREGRKEGRKKEGRKEARKECTKLIYTHKEKEVKTNDSLPTEQLITQWL